MQLNDKSVENKSSDEVQNNKTNESNDELLQIFLIDDNKDNESNDLIVGNDSVEGMEWSLVVDESEGQLESNSRPIIVQLTDELRDKSNESLVNLETAEVQHKDNNNSIDISINQTKTFATLLQKDDSMAVEVEESVETVPKDSSVNIEVETVPKDSSVNIEVETVLKDSSVDTEVGTIPKDSSVNIEVETVLKDSSVDIEVETVPKDSSVNIEVETVPIDSSVNIDVEDAQQSVPELIKYVSMPTLCFDDNQNEPKSKSTEVEDNRSDEQMSEKSLNNDSNNDKQTDEVGIREEVVQQQQVEEDLSSEELFVDILSEELSPKETVNEENKDSEEMTITDNQNEENKDSEEMTITDNQNTDNPKIVLNEELINSRVQHPVVSSSVEDFLPNSPLSSSSSSSNSGKIVAQKTLGVDKNSALFLPNSPLSASDSEREVIAPTTTIVISPTDHNSLNNCLMNDQIIDKNQSDIEVPQNRNSDQSIDKVFNANVSLYLIIKTFFSVYLYFILICY